MTEAVHPVLTAAATYRAQLLRQEDAAVRRLVAAYGAAYQRMGAQIAALQEALNGEPMTFAQATRMTRLQALREQIQGEIGRFGIVADNELQQTSRQAIELGLNHATGLVEAYFTSNAARGALRASFTQLQPAQIETMLGFLADDSPLRQGLVNQLGESVAARVSDRLVDGMVRGFNPNKTAGIVRRELGVGLAWAINTTRTANLWAYREATRANYAANPRVVSGWIWHSALDARVCGNCLSQHGSRHPVSETLNGHHQCRCAMIPILPLAQSLGLDLPEIEPGEAWYRRQDEATQRGILGPGLWRAWKEGAVTFDQFKGHSYDHPAYGEMQRMPTMAQLGLQRYYTRAERAVESATPRRRATLADAVGLTPTQRSPVRTEVQGADLFARLDAEFGGGKLRLGSAEYIAMRQRILDYIDSGNLSLTGAFHGMPQATTLRGVAFGNQEIYFEDADRVKSFLITLYRAHNDGQQLPPTLVDATKRLIFTSQTNKDDDYWRRVYTNFTASRATGGDGDIVVYGNKLLPVDAYAHEMGHNLANRLYGSTRPDTQSRYMAAMQGEAPVSEYAKNGPSEDFAEAVARYVTDRVNFATNHPQRYAVIDQIMRSGDE